MPNGCSVDLAAMTDAERAAMAVMAPGRGDVIVAGGRGAGRNDALLRVRPCPGERDRHPGRSRLRDARHPVTSSAVCRSDPGTSNSPNSRSDARPSAAPPSDAAISRSGSSPAASRLILVVVGAFILFGGGDDQTDAASPSVSAEPGTDRGLRAMPRSPSTAEEAEAARSTRRRRSTIDPVDVLHGHHGDLVRHDRDRTAARRSLPRGSTTSCSWRNKASTTGSRSTGSWPSS